MSRRKLQMMSVAVRKDGRTYKVNLPRREVRDFRARLEAAGQRVSMNEAAKRLVRGAIERGIFKLSEPSNVYLDRGTPRATGPA